MKGLPQHKLSTLINHTPLDKHDLSPIELDQDRLLIVTDVFTFIYNHQTGKLIAQKILCLSNSESPFIVPLDDIYFTEKNMTLLALQKTNRNREGERNRAELRVIPFNDAFSDLMGFREGTSFKMFKLSNGNFLHVSKKSLHKLEY